MAYTQHFQTKKTAQSQAIPGKTMVQNHAGGFVFQVSKWTQFDRFLILGSEGNTFYVSGKDLSVENAKNAIECIKNDGLKAVQRIVEISDGGRAPKNDPAVFALALACTFGDEETKAFAYSKIPAVCRIGTHIFQFCQEIQNLRGWSRGLRRGVSSFYTDRTADKLAYQLIKYQQRNGWSHKDVITLSHPAARSPEQNVLFRWAIGKASGAENLHPQVKAMEEIMTLGSSTKDIKKAVNLILEHGLPREAVPTTLLNSEDVWDALLQEMPLTAIVRNLGKMTAVGLLDSNLSDATKLVVSKLTNREVLKKARIHPLNVLVASRTYSQGHGDKGSLSWSPVSSIASALDDSFYGSFDAVEPTGKNFFLGIDVSGSMCGRMGNLPLTYSEAAAAMAMVAVRTEPYCEVMGFDTGIKRLPITKNHTFAQASRIVEGYNGGGTDCSLPMVYATSAKLPVDVFNVYTDNETYYGSIHPSQALQEYRRVSGRAAKSIVFGMAAYDFSIADPSDAGMLDVCGFDTSVPSVMASFVRG